MGDKQKLEQTLRDDMLKIVNSKEPSIEILVTGKVGVGKSTLVNALVGMNVAKAGDNVTTVTKYIQRKVAVRNGIHVYITDTPGFGNVDLDDEDMLRAALKHNKHTDLLLFCMNITERFDHQHINTIKAITKVFGKGVWKKGLFALTSANLLDEERFGSKLDEWENELRKKMKQIIDPQVAAKIPIVPTGFKEPYLPDRPSWVSELWVQGFRRMGFKPTLYMILLNRNRLQDTTDGMKLGQDKNESPEDQPRVTCWMSKDEKLINPQHIPMIS